MPNTTTVDIDAEEAEDGAMVADGDMEGDTHMEEDTHMLPTLTTLTMDELGKSNAPKSANISFNVP